MQSLKTLLSNHFLKCSLLPILVIEVALLVLYFSINFYITRQNISRLQKDALAYGTKVMNSETEKINRNLAEISGLTRIMQHDHQRILGHPERYNILDIPDLQVAPNGVMYKTTRKGASLYYSSRTPIGQAEKAKAIISEAMDPLLIQLVETNETIEAAYFNSHDDMNRLYPYIDKVYDQYGEHINMEDYNFYYLADAQHNPTRGPVWTEAYLDPAGNGWMLSCIAPIYTGGNFLEGVSGVDITIEKLLANILDLQLPYNARVFMLDAKGTLIAIPPDMERLFGLQELKDHAYTDPITKTITKPDNFNIFKNSGQFSIHLRETLQDQKVHSELTLGSNEYLLMHQIIKETGWNLMIMIDKEKVLASVNELKRLSNTIGLAAIMLMAIFYLGFFYYLVKRSNQVSAAITEPIEMLTEQTSQFGFSGMEVKAIETDIEEIYRLNTNFTQMLNELDARTARLVEMELQKKASEQEAQMYLDQSMRDSLTGLYNRNKMDDLLKYLLGEFTAHGMKFSVLFVDIDHFKQINDSLGHSAGDEVLKELAYLLTANTRQRDAVCRIGGEEFVVFCATHGFAALKIAEKLRESIAHHTFSIQRKVTASFGVTEVTEGDTEDSILLRADKALYQAKSRGRNRVEFSRDAASAPPFSTSGDPEHSTWNSSDSI